MYFTGFADEAAKGIDGQIQATLDLGWKNIEARAIDGVNIHDLDDAAFDAVAGKLEAAGVHINCFGSAIANWGKSIEKEEDFQKDLEQTRRAIPRMQRLGTHLVRIMSYAVLEDRSPEDQFREKRIQRLREIVDLFLEAGIQPVHENCMNYGGMGWSYTLDLIDNVPGLKLVFDTGNPVFNKDRTKKEPFPMQSSWEFYSAVRDYVAYIHIKDGRMTDGKMVFSYCGEGDGDVQRILNDAFAGGYNGGISIEPHIGAVFHDPSIQSDAAKSMAMYHEYGLRIQKIVAEAQRLAQQAN